MSITVKSVSRFANWGSLGYLMLAIASAGACIAFITFYAIPILAWFFMVLSSILFISSRDSFNKEYSSGMEVVSYGRRSRKKD